MEEFTLYKGIVIGSSGPLYQVEVDGTEICCVLRGKLRKKQLRVTSLCVAGDRVTVDMNPDGTGAICDIEDRKSVLERPGFHGYIHAVAANIDLLVIVQSARQPSFKAHLVDRFLVTAQRGNLQPLLVVNKCDLESPEMIRSWVSPFLQNGIRVVLTSAASASGLEELRSVLMGQISVLAGQSGVGKSSLINAMFPEINARVGEIASWNQKGRHTTTSSRLYRLPSGGYLADTPGIRTLELMEEDQTTFMDVFPDILSLSQGCRFRDCSHTHEPGCAVKDAVSSGALGENRYRSYVRIWSRT